MHITRLNISNKNVKEQLGNPRFLNAEDVESFKVQKLNIKKKKPITASTPIPSSKPALSGTPNKEGEKHQPIVTSTPTPSSKSPLPPFQKQDSQSEPTESPSNLSNEKRKIPPSVSNTPSKSTSSQLSKKRKDEEARTSKSFMQKIKSVLSPSKSKENQRPSTSAQSNVNRKLKFDTAESNSKLNATFPQSKIENKTDEGSLINVTFPMVNRQRVELNEQQELSILLNKDMAMKKLKKTQLKRKLMSF